MKFIKTKNIHRYSEVLTGLYDDFGDAFCHTMLVWCDVVIHEPSPNFWEVWLIENDDIPIGVCGLYSKTQMSCGSVGLVLYQNIGTKNSEEQFSTFLK